MNVFTGLSLFPETHGSIIFAVATVGTEVFRRIPLFRNLDDETLSALAGLARIRCCVAGETIVKQDLAAEALYVILNGSATVSVSARDGRSLTLREIGRTEI